MASRAAAQGKAPVTGSESAVATLQSAISYRVLGFDQTDLHGSGMARVSVVSLVLELHTHTRPIPYALALELGSFPCAWIRFTCAVDNSLQPVSNPIAHRIDVRERQIVFETGFHVSCGAHMSTQGSD